jgi:hypothetical protein
VIKTVVHTTSDSEGKTAVPEFVGMDVPHAFLMNYQAQGYAKFIIPPITLTAFEKGGLIKVKDSLTRLQTYFMLYHMVKYGNISGSQAMAIICNNIGDEKSESVLSLVLNQLVPVIIKKFLPLDQIGAVNQKMFDATEQILNSQEHVLSTAQMLVTSLIGFSSEGAASSKLVEWFSQGYCLKEEFSLTLKQKHAIVMELASSTEVSQQQKDKMMKKLEEEPSDMIQNTKAYCRAANPDTKTKKEVWDGLFGTTFDQESLLDH